MRLSARYRRCHEDGWNLWIRSESWSQGLWKEVLRHLDEHDRSNPARLRRFRYSLGERTAEFCLKIYDRSRMARGLKDFLRDSGAFRALKQSHALRRLGFHAPLAIAAGEMRRSGLLVRAFLLTLAVDGSPLYLFLAKSLPGPQDKEAIKKKREHLKHLAWEIRRLHQSGFVHGDLTHSNIVVQSREGAVTFFFMDNDRTRRYVRRIAEILGRRNLVQLNRFALAGISLQDRVRFLRSYLGRVGWTKGDRRFIRWLEEKTRARLREFGELEEGASFRSLMRWKGSF